MALYHKYVWVVFVFKYSFKSWICYVFCNRIKLTVSRIFRLFTVFEKKLFRLSAISAIFNLLCVICLKVKVSLISRIVSYQLRFLYLSFHSDSFAYYKEIFLLFFRKLLRSLDLFIISLESCFAMKGI